MSAGSRLLFGQKRLKRTSMDHAVTAQNHIAETMEESNHAYAIDNYECLEHEKKIQLYNL